MGLYGAALWIIDQFILKVTFFSLSCHMYFDNSDAWMYGYIRYINYNTEIQEKAKRPKKRLYFEI